MTSLRAKLIASFTALLTVAGLIGGGIAYLVARQDPDAFLDDQLRQIAINVTDVKSAAERIAADPSLDPTDIIVVQTWDGENRLINSPPTLEIPRQASSGFHEVTTADGPWRIYTMIQNGRTTQVSQRLAVRQELALAAAWQAILPV